MNSDIRALQHIPISVKMGQQALQNDLNAHLNATYALLTKYLLE
jgi:hypothetical protein